MKEALREAEQALQQSAAFNRALIASLPHKLFLKDRSSVYLSVNEAYASSLGCQPEQMVGKDDFAFFPTELAEQYRADDREVMESGQGKAIEERYLAQGTEYWIRTIKAPLRNDAGEVTAVLGLFEDVTERKRAEDALEASEARYRRLFEAAKDGILILAGDTGRVEDVNPYLLELTGLRREDFVGKQLWEVGLFEDIARARSSFDELRTEKYVRYEDLPLKARDGRSIDVEFVSNVYSVGERNVIQCNIRDITERKRAEVQSERLVRAIEHAAEIVMITDARGDILYTNPAFEAVTGYTCAEVVGKNPRLLRSGAQDKAFYRALWSTITRGETWHGRLVNKRKDGTHYTEDATISPVLDAAGNISSYVAVKRDITPVLALEAQFLQSQKMEGIGRLAGGVAHDFNNLLTVILNYTGFALQELQEGDPLRDDLLEVKKAGEYAASLTRQLLAFSRKQVLQPQTLELNSILTDMERMLRRIIGEDIALVRVAARDLGLVEADPSQIEQVLMNLVINARDAMPQGGKLTIETANKELDEHYAGSHVGVQPGDYVMLAVSDTGCGMDAQTRAKVFDPFFTTKEQGKGTGLGLSTVFGIITQSGGHVWVYSELGKGTTFKVYLRRQHADGTVRPTQRPLRAPLMTGTETILVVDDDEAVRKAVRRTLAAAGYTVLMAASGAEALLVSAQHAGEIQLLLTDVVMPAMSGTALVDELAKTGRKLRVLYTSGYTDDTIGHHGVLDPGIHFLSKPFAVNELTRKVRQVLDSDE